MNNAAKYLTLLIALGVAAACGGPLEGELDALDSTSESLRSRTIHPTYPKKLDRADMISPTELDRTQGGYSLEVPGIGKVLLDNDDPRVTSGCYLHRPSLIQQIAANPPTASGQQWLNLSIYDCPWGTCCLGPMGGACYKMIRLAAP